MAGAPEDPRLVIGPQAIGVVLAGIGLALVVFATVTAASRTIGWAVATTVVAALIEPLVARLDRYLPRMVAVLVVLVGLAALGAALAGGVLADLGNQYDRLQREAPRAAERLEESPRFGDVATDFRLTERVEEILDRVERPTDSVPASAASTVSTYLVCAVLTIFLLSWGPRFATGALGQVGDRARREALRRTVGVAYARARLYVAIAAVLGIGAGLVALAACTATDLPAPIVLSAFVAGASVIPGFGILLGSLPALLLAGAFSAGTTTAVLACGAVALQAAHEVLQRRALSGRSLVVGPAAIVIALSIGFEIYGFGGAAVGAVLAVFAMALLDAAGDLPEPDGQQAEAPVGTPAGGA